MRRGSATDTEFEASTAQMVEHADLLEQAHGMVGRQQVDQRTKPQPPGPLRQSRHPNARRRSHAQRGAVVLAHVEAVEAQTVVELRKPKPLFVLFSEREAGTVVLIEDAKF